MRPSTRTATFVTCITICVLPLYGCDARPLITHVEPIRMEQEQLLAELAADADEVVRLTGVKTGWRSLHTEPTAYWDIDRDRILQTANNLPCGRSEFAYEWDLSFMLDKTDRAFQIAEQVRKAWEAEGWKVSDLYETENVPTEQQTYVHLVVRFEDGALMDFWASEQSASFTVASVCAWVG